MKLFRHSSQMVEDGDGQWIHITDHQAALDEVLEEAVWAMLAVQGYEMKSRRYNSDEYLHAQAFLASPLVAAYQQWKKKSQEGV